MSVEINDRDELHRLANSAAPQWLRDLAQATLDYADDVSRSVLGAISDTVEFSAVSSGPLMTIPDLDVDYQWVLVVVTAGGRTALPIQTPPEPEPVDIVDQIDELVNDQLANYGNRSGYDHNVNQELCWHCGRDWHGLKITARIEQMRARGHYDEDYRYADDDSEVLCEGSEFIGPMKYPALGPMPSFLSGITGTIVDSLLEIMGVSAIPVSALPPTDNCQAISRAGFGMVAGQPFYPQYELSEGSWVLPETEGDE